MCSLNLLVSLTLSLLLFATRLQAVSVGAPLLPSYQNEMDRLLFAIGSSANGHLAPLCGMQSYHSDPYEDRQFKWVSCPILTSANRLASRVSTLPITAFDLSWTRVCPSYQVLVAVAASHSDPHEDREFQFTCMQFAGTKKSNCRWSFYVNDFDRIVDYRCPRSFVLDGIRSYHHNGYEDRRYAFRCCQLVNL